MQLLLLISIQLILNQSSLARLKNLNVNDYIDRKEARKLDRYTQLALISAIQGVEDCGIDLEKADKNRIGVVYGVGIGGIKTFEEEIG